MSLLILGGTPAERENKALEIFGFKELPINDPDFFGLNQEIGMGIEEIRELQKWLVLKPYAKPIKNVLIAEAENLTLPAQNALLKTLEEPPEKCLIILTSATELIPTIMSRCQIINLPAKSQISLSQEEKIALQNELLKIMEAKPGQRLALGEKMGLYENKDKAREKLNQITLVLREVLIDNMVLGLLAKKDILRLIKVVNKTKKCLLVNTNVRLTIEAFLIEL